MTWIAIFVLMFTIGVMAYFSVRALYWLTFVPLSIVGLILSDQISISWGAVIGGLFLILASLYLFPHIRRDLVAAPLLKQFRRVIPPISKTEQEALEAGTVWLDREFFSGKPNWNQLLAYPAAKLTEQERAFIDGPVEELCRRLDDWSIYEQQDLTPELWQFIKSIGLFGLIIPKQYGGLGFSALAHSTIVMKLATRSVPTAVTVMVPNSLGPAKLLLHYGTEQQRDYYLPRLATGEEVPCFALTGPTAGSDAGSIPDIGVVEYAEFNGKTTLGVRLNFEKRYITLAPIATLIGLAFKLKDPDHLLGDDVNPGITVALIPRQTQGIEIGRRHRPLQIGFQNGPIVGKDLFIPLDWVVGGAHGVGQGWRMLVECLTEGRGISLPALATGAGKAACRFTGAYAAVRRQFGQPIGRFEGVEEVLAAIAGTTYQMEAARRLTLSALDNSITPSVITAIVKYHLTERYRQVINHAMDVQGGSGICLGPHNLIARAYQAVPIAITVEGANILTRNMIIFGQGAIRAHPYLLDEFNAAREPEQKKALRAFDQALVGHIAHLSSNLLRAFWLGLTRGVLAKQPIKGPTGRYFQQLERFSSAFSLTADFALMTLGGSLKKRERLSARLGDILSELYIATAVIKHFINQGQPKADIALLHHAMADSLYRIDQAFKQLFRNFPLPMFGWLVRFIVFPTGSNFLPPSDRDDRTVSQILLQPGAARERLTRDVYVSRDLNEQIGRLEHAFELAYQVEPIEATLRQSRRQGVISGEDRNQLIEDAQAKGVIEAEHVELLQRADRAREAVIQVDAFTTVPANTLPFKRNGKKHRKTHPHREGDAA